jgi:glycolate oxidase FAD binding subunit
MAGSYGTLAALEEVTIKVLPRPETSLTLLLSGLAPEDASLRMAAALGSPHEISGAAYLPEAAASSLLPDRPGIVALRLEGPAPSVAFRRDALLAEVPPGSASRILEDSASLALWRAIGDGTPLAGLADPAIWRISVAPSRGALLGVAIAQALAARWYLDWGGGLLWIAVAAGEDCGAALIRGALAEGGRGAEGHATLIAAPPGLRRAVAVFEPLPEPLALLSARVKESFDPHHILNPGRMVAGV